MAHNGSLIPVPGRDIMVQAWYQGGISVFDFTDSANPREIAWFDRGPQDPTLGRRRQLVDVLVQRLHLLERDPRGFDVFELRDRRVAGAKLNVVDELNAQMQERYRIDPR